MLSLDTSSEEVTEGVWIIDGNEIPVYVMEDPDWSQFDSTQHKNIDRNVLYGILRSYRVIAVAFTYTDPAFMRIDFENGEAEMYNVALQELDNFVNEFVEFPLPSAIPLERRSRLVDWKKEGF